MKTNRSFGGKIIQTVRREARWLMPGIGVKRWMLIILIGITFLALGIAFILINIYRTVPESVVSNIIAFLSLQFLNRLLRALIFGTIGLGLVIYGFWGLNRSLLRPFIQPGKPIIDTVICFSQKGKRSTHSCNRRWQWACHSASWIKSLLKKFDCNCDSSG